MTWDLADLIRAHTCVYSQQAGLLGGGVLVGLGLCQLMWLHLGWNDGRDWTTCFSSPTRLSWIYLCYRGKFQESGGITQTFSRCWHGISRLLFPFHSAGQKQFSGAARILEVGMELFLYNGKNMDLEEWSIKYTTDGKDTRESVERKICWSLPLKITWSLWLCF